MKPLIVMPTYNEAPNIEKIIRMVFSNTANLAPTHLLVVDDNSPDGTAAIVKSLMQNEFNGSLFLLQRDRKYGLGTAYIDGFSWGLGKDYDTFVEMDADFSHHPRYLEGMLAKTESFDVIVGSRYVKGGGVKGWGLTRKFISVFGSLYAKTILNLPIHDLTGGFNIWKRDVLNKIDLKTVKSEGYAFQIELKYRAFVHGFRLFEYPIVFEDRLHGKSKMSKKIVAEAIYRVWQLRLSNIGRVS
jgi:dolichol-phosphate mannosyltransferase